MNNNIPEHKYLTYESPLKGRRILRDIAVELMNYYTKQNLSRKKWLRKDRRCIQSRFLAFQHRLYTIFMYLLR